MLTVRTHVPFVADIRTRTAGARRVPAHQLAPLARGRRSRRLGGRRERASRRSSTMGAAARAHFRAAPRNPTAPRPAAACGPGVRLARQWSSSRRPAAAGARSRRPARACAPVLRTQPAHACACDGPSVARSPADPASLRLAAWLRARSDTRATSRGPPAGGPLRKTGGVLLSQALASQVPSALRGLTALFGMGRGVSPSPRPPESVERPPLRVLQNCTAPHGHQNIRQALDPLVPVSFRRYRPSRSGLSTWWSTRGLTPSRGWENSSRGRLPA